MKIAQRVTKHNRICGNNSSLVALAGLNEAIRLEKEYPSREFLTDIKRAREVFNKMRYEALSGAYQVWTSQGPLFESVALCSIGHGGNQHRLRVTLTLGRVVTVHTLPTGHSKRSVGYAALIEALQTLADADEAVLLKHDV